MLTPSNAMFITALTTLGLTLLSISAPPAAAAEQTKTTEVQLNEVQEQIEVTSKSLKHDKKALDAHIKQLAKIETQISDIDRDVHARQHNLMDLQNQLAALDNERLNIENKLATQQQQLADQIQAAYMQGNHQGFKLLLNIQNAEYVNRVMTYYDYIHQMQSTLITQIKQTLAALEKNTQAINTQQKTINESYQVLQQRLQALQVKRDDRQQWIDKIQGKLKSKSLELEKLREDARSLETVIAKAQHKPIRHAGSDDTFHQSIGSLAWPVAGNIEHRFGDLIQNKLHWKGMVIASEPGTSVMAPAGGQVVFADWMRGFGLLMIIDHGHGFLSLYGRNQVLYKQSGDDVAAGEVIGLVGTSGGFAKPGLYFEIRHHGLPVDPEKWLSKEAA